MIFSYRGQRFAVRPPQVDMELLKQHVTMAAVPLLPTRSLEDTFVYDSVVRCHACGLVAHDKKRQLCFHHVQMQRILSTRCALCKKLPDGEHQLRQSVCCQTQTCLECFKQWAVESGEAGTGKCPKCLIK